MGPEKNNKPVFVYYLEVLSVFSIFLYFLGFVVWNFYLNLLEFSQFDFIQVRYVLTGFLFVVFFALFCGICFATLQLAVLAIVHVENLIYKIFNIKSKGRVGKFVGFPTDAGIYSQIFFITLAFLVFLPFFVNNFFPSIPGSWGGAAPRSIALVAQKETIDFWRVYGLGSKAENTYTQTSIVCALYENEDSIILLLEDRLVEVNKGSLLGKVSTPSVEITYQKKKCSEYIYSYLSPEGRTLR